MGGFAHADSISSLTKSNVTDFIEETTSMTSGDSFYDDHDAIIEYLKKHIHEDARFISTLRFTFPGLSPQDTRMSLGKEEFINSVDKGDKALTNYENEIEITSVRISRDKKKATVKTTGSESGELPTPTEDGGVQNVPVDGVSECTQILTLEGGVIQMFNANCLTSIDLLNF